MISCICYKSFVALRFLGCVVNLGKGEVESSILSCSTIFSKVYSSLAQSGQVASFAARQNMARTDRDLARPRVQNACSRVLEGLSHGL